MSLVQKFLLEQLLDLYFELLLKTSAEFVYQFLRGWGLHLHLQEILFWTSMIFQIFLVSWLSSYESMHQNSVKNVVAAGY